MSKRRTFALLAGLYVSQYLGIGFFYTALVAILRERGAALDQLGAVQILGFVWAAKVLWAPLLDRFGGRYRRWLLVLQPAIVLGFLALTLFDPVADFGPLMVVCALVVALSATQDVAADALAVRALAAADRGVGNGIQTAGGYLGNALGGGAVLVVYDRLGWPAALVTLAVLAAIPIWQVVRYAEPPRPATGPRPGFRALLSIFGEPGVARWAFGVLPLLWIGASAAYALTTPMLVDAGWDLGTIGVVTTVVAGSCAMAAAAGSGLVVQRLGRRRAIIVFGAVQAGAVLGLLPLAAGLAQPLLVGVAVCLMHASYAAVLTVVSTVNMDLSRASTAGTDYTVLSSVAFVASLLAGTIALTAAQRLGYPAVIAGAAATVCLALIVAARFFVAGKDIVNAENHGPGARRTADRLFGAAVADADSGSTVPTTRAD